MAEHAASELIAVSEILVRDRLRQVDFNVTPALVESIQQRGLLTPILVRENPDSRSPAYVLIAGAHRLEACKKLGWGEIPAIISDVKSDDEARLIEVDENLIRAELDPLDEAFFLSKRKEVYERLFPETKNGAQGGRGGKKKKTEIFSFSKETARRLGCHPRAIEMKVKIARDLTPHARFALDPFKHSISQKDLLELVALDPEQQVKAARMMEDADIGTLKLSQAIRTVKGDGEKAAPSDEQQYATLLALWGRTGAAARAKFLAWLDAGQPEADQDEAA